jgi:hypothetical protein
MDACSVQHFIKILLCMAVTYFLGFKKIYRAIDKIYINLNRINKCLVLTRHLKKLFCDLLKSKYQKYRTAKACNPPIKCSSFLFMQAIE